MARIFTIFEDEPVNVTADLMGLPPEAERWVILPAGTALAVAAKQKQWRQMSDEGGWVAVPEFEEDLGVVVTADGTVAEFPMDTGMLGDGEPDDISGLPLLTVEEVIRLRPNLAELFEELEPDPEYDEMRRIEAEEDRQYEALQAVEERDGRLSVAYLEQLRRTPFGTSIDELAELAELYDDDSLREAVRQHPYLKYEEELESVAQRGAALGLISRMLVAEAVMQPGVRQADLKGAMGISSGPQTQRTYPLGKAGFLNRTSVKTQVFLAPGERCGELGLDADSAAALIAWRDGNPGKWAEVIRRATREAWTSPPRIPDILAEYLAGDSFSEVLGAPDIDDGSIPFGSDAPSARAWPRVPDVRADNPHILKWWTTACDEAMTELIRRWRWHYPWKLSEAITVVVGKDTIDRWAAEDPICHQYAYYNVLMYFGIARARRIGLERALPMPQERTCMRCKTLFAEDRVPMRQVQRLASGDTIDHCKDCSR